MIKYLPTYLPTGQMKLYLWEFNNNILKKKLSARLLEFQNIIYQRWSLKNQLIIFLKKKNTLWYETENA